MRERGQSVLRTLRGDRRRSSRIVRKDLCIRRKQASAVPLCAASTFGKTSAAAYLLRHGKSAFYMLDLQPDRSLIRELLFLGVDVYLLDWGYPDGADRFTPWRSTSGGPRTLRRVRSRRNAIDGLNLLGVLSGREFGLCYAALSPQQNRQPDHDGDAGGFQDSRKFAFQVGATYRYRSTPPNRATSPVNS